jgi:DNA-binding protein YbaB
MKNLGQMMQKVQEMQTRMGEMQARLAEMEVVGQSGGGMVAARASCAASRSTRRWSIRPRPRCWKT